MQTTAIMSSISMTYLLSLAFRVLSFTLFASGKNCETLEGRWYNQLGSEICLEHRSDGSLVGEYRTAVERLNGSAGVTHSIVLGKYYKLIAFLLQKIPYISV